MIGRRSPFDRVKKRTRSVPGASVVRFGFARRGNFMRLKAQIHHRDTEPQRELFFARQGDDCRAKPQAERPTKNPWPIENEGAALLTGRRLPSGQKRNLLCASVPLWLIFSDR